MPRPHAQGTPVNSPIHDFPHRFRFLFVHLKVHKALRHLITNHPNGSGIPFRPDEAFDDMQAYDWSRVKVRLVMSVPGSYSGVEQVDDFGLCRLGKILSEEGWKPQKGDVVKAEFQVCPLIFSSKLPADLPKGSSLGSYSLDWFDTFYQYCTGRTTSSLIGRSKPTSWPPVKVIFPSLATVNASILGREVSAHDSAISSYCIRVVGRCFAERL